MKKNDLVGYLCSLSQRNIIHIFLKPLPDFTYKEVMICSKIKRRRNLPQSTLMMLFILCVGAHIQIHCNKAICIPLTFQTEHHLSFPVKQKGKKFKTMVFSNVEKILYTHSGCLQITELKFIFSHICFFFFLFLLNGLQDLSSWNQG